MNPDQALKALHAIYENYGQFVQTRGRVSEADTRANILDRLLHEVLGWPREAVKREPHSKVGYLDYKLLRGSALITIEAKASGESFIIPHNKSGKSQRLVIGGTLSTDPTVKAALEQAHGYCAEVGTRFAVVTNGYSFVIFRAISEGESWRSTSAIVFPGVGTIEADFTTFWNLLSYEAVCDGKLDDAFRRGDVSSRGHHRPIRMIVDSDATYTRNPINIALRPYVDTFFGDIAAQNTLEVLRECYVHSRPVQIIDDDLQLIIKDHPPAFSNAFQLKTSPSDGGGGFSQHLDELTSNNQKGSVILLMGGIGSGKTTFLTRFFSVVAPEISSPQSRTFLLQINFLGAPDTIETLDAFLWDRAASNILTDLPSFKDREVLEQIFSQQLDIIRRVYADQPGVLSSKLSDRLFELAQNNKEFTQNALKFLVSQGRLPFVVFDNVDQLGIHLQTHIFTLTEHLAQHFSCLALLVIREETYSAALMQKQLTAYHIKAYHLSSPSFRHLIKLRLEFATNDAAKHQSEGALFPDEPSRATTDEILEFFNLLRNSVFTENLKIVGLLEAISFGNMRLALALFNVFLLSGAANFRKILDIFRVQGRYLVPFHEFAKSIILGDFRFYKEARSHVFNLFDITSARNASHFTALRILNYLTDVPDSHPSGEGFIDLQTVVSAFVDTFDNEDDCLKTLLRLSAVNRQLIEFDTRRPDTLTGAYAVRISSSGRYYMAHFVEEFAYLDLVWHDTPFNDRGIADQLTKLMHSTDLLERLRRVEMFLDYLDREEKSEHTGLPASECDSSIRKLFVPRIRAGFAQCKSSVERYVEMYNSHSASRSEPFGQRLNLDGFAGS